MIYQTPLKTLGLALLTIFTLPALAMESLTKAQSLEHSIQSKKNQDQLNEQLIGASRNNDITKALDLLARGAEVDTQCDEWGWTLLMEAIEIDSKTMCELLLEHGANITLANATTSNALDKASIRSESLCKLLISHASFNPRPSKQQRLESQSIIFTILCSLKRLVPQMPKDVCYYLLNVNPQLRAHAHNCAFRMHRNNHEAAPFLPLPVLRVLVEEKKMLTLDAAIDTIKKHKLAILREHMIDAMTVAKTPEIKALLDPNAFDNNFGEDIKQYLTTQLASK